MGDLWADEELVERSGVYNLQDFMTHYTTGPGEMEEADSNALAEGEAHGLEGSL